MRHSGANLRITQWFGAFLLAGAFLGVRGPIAAFAANSLYIGGDNPGPGLEEISATQLKSGGAAAPTIISNVSTVNGAIGVCFDKKKNLWVPTLDVTLLEFTAAQLKQLSKSPNPTPALTLSSTSFGFLLSCALDKKGNLWLVDSMQDGIHEISAAQLVSASGATITPTVDLSDSTDLASPAYATFDKSGNLWMSSFGNSNIVMFPASQITSSSNTITGSVVISSTALVGPGQMQFDKKGTLWVVNTGAANDAQVIPPSILGFTKSQLTASGSVTPAIVISSTILSDGSASLDVPWSMAFDSSGNMWVYNYTSGEFPTVDSSWVDEFAKKGLKAGGALAPTVQVTGLARYSGELTFGPATK